ncbi:DUF4190 domain-containing protein [Streptomyces sp. CA-278952]|uniref:DUF4190 domain-containing protein n=1 Tax=unclassified Streptomyces TaxID=2593676 RepID=UPI002368304D|nr:DUF4190 domain-containing protein [Streptomyces sp. CA-278952]WDG29037.1 DUF4190 domain-containing protein [Streptomyces sp. CA-278952]
MPRPPLSGLAVASLVLSLLVCLAPLGLVLGIVALVRISRSGKRGKGMAVAGTAVGGAVVTLTALLLVIGGVRFTAWTEEGGSLFGPRAPKTGTLFDLKAGDCFAPAGGLFSTQERGDERMTDPSVEIVPCDGPHPAEVYGTFRLKGDYAISDPVAIAAEAFEGCVPLLHDFAPDTWTLPAVEFSFYYPESVSTTGGDRTVRCWLGSEAGLPEASLRQDPGTWDAGQLAYLEAMRPSSEAWFSASEKVDTDLAAATAWAVRMAEGGAESAKLLRAIDGLPARARGPVIALANRLDALSGIHRSASRAPTLTEFDKRWDNGGDEDASGEEWEARLVLGLPVEDEEGDGGEQRG